MKERRAAITKVVGRDVRKTFHICAQKKFVQQKMGMLIIVVVQIPFLVVQNMVDCEFVCISFFGFVLWILVEIILRNSFLLYILFPQRFNKVFTFD